MKSWSRIHRDCSDSRRLSELLARHPFADALFWRLKAWCDDYGRFLADPMKVLAKVAGRAAIEFGLPLADVADALDVLEALNLIRRYEANGELYLELVDYDKHDAPLWLNVSRPEYPAPPWWTPPASLVEFLSGHLLKRNVTLARYGIDETNCPPELRAHLTPVEQTVEPLLSGAEQTVQQTAEQPVQQTRPRPTLTLTQDNTNVNDLLSEAADDAAPDTASEPSEQTTPADHPDTKQRRTSLKRKARPDDEVQADLDELRAKLPSTLLPLLDLWLDNLASHNTSGAMTLGRTLSESIGFADLVHVHGLSEAAIRHGVTTALGRVDRKDHKPGVTNIAFVLEVASGGPPGGNGRASPSAQPPLTYHDREILALLGKEEATTGAVGSD
jgi:hypothetical protein